jgi:hypothetical protein
MRRVLMTLFSSLAQRRGVPGVPGGLLAPRDRNKTLTALAGAEPVTGAATRGYEPPGTPGNLKPAAAHLVTPAHRTIASVCTAASANCSDPVARNRQGACSPPIYRPAALTARIDRAGGEGAGTVRAGRGAPPIQPSAVGQDLASAASKPWVGRQPDGQCSANSPCAAPRLVPHVTHQRAGTGAKSCATAQLCA